MRDAVLVLTGPAEAIVQEAALIAGGRIGAQPRRLWPRAWEMPAGQADLAVLRSALDRFAVDANLVPGAGRRKRLLIADMDSTIIEAECLDELADLAGVGPEVAAITERAMAGSLDFEGALRERVALLARAPEALLERVWEERIRLTAGARVLVRSMGAKGAATALVSGGFTFFTGRVAAAVGFAEHRANRLLAEDGYLTGQVAEPILGREAKVQALEALMAGHGIAAAEVLAVGDGANDLGMIKAAGLGVGFRPKALLAAEADAVLEHSDLTALLALQGFAAEEVLWD
ncbi:MAG: phosphoserine phosphatase SerB [Pseudomonadota bacterium]